MVAIQMYKNGSEIVLLYWDKFQIDELKTNLLQR